jgi:uncharacterized protein YndB with AHSA1/START domain
MTVPKSDFRIFGDGATSLVTTRSFNAPVASLKRAHLEPELLRQWMGSAEMPMEVCEIDARVGGEFRIGYRMQDGSMMWVFGTYTEITDTRIVHTEQFDPDWQGGQSIEAVDFIAQGERTLLRSEVRYASAATRDGALEAGPSDSDDIGMAHVYDRLEAMLAGKSLG